MRNSFKHALKQKEGTWIFKERLTEEIAHVLISSSVVARIYDISEDDIVNEINKKADKYGFDRVKGEQTMIKIENVEIYGWEPTIRGMRNPLNSWEKSDSEYECIDEDRDIYEYVIGPNDLDLMKRLSNGGPVHAKYRRMITVYMDITAPFYWWKEFSTYKVGTVTNSCSTMHKIHAKEFTLEDFSTDHLFGDEDILKWDERTDIAKDHALAAVNVNGDWCYFSPKGYIQMTCNMLNRFRQLYLETKDKKYWWQMIQLLPTSYNQKRTVMLNYEVLANIYKSRKDHKLDEWRKFCEWIEELPFSELITGEDPVECGV